MSSQPSHPLPLQRTLSAPKSILRKPNINITVNNITRAIICQHPVTVPSEPPPTNFSAPNAQVDIELPTTPIRSSQIPRPLRLLQQNRTPDQPAPTVPALSLRRSPRISTTPASVTARPSVGASRIAAPVSPPASAPISDATHKENALLQPASVRAPPTLVPHLSTLLPARILRGGRQYGPRAPEPAARVTSVQPGSDYGAGTQSAARTGFGSIGSSVVGTGVGDGVDPAVAGAVSTVSATPRRSIEEIAWGLEAAMRIFEGGSKMPERTSSAPMPARLLRSNTTAATVSDDSPASLPIATEPANDREQIQTQIGSFLDFCSHCATFHPVARQYLLAKELYQQVHGDRAFGYKLTRKRILAMERWCEARVEVWKVESWGYGDAASDETIDVENVGRRGYSKERPNEESEHKKHEPNESGNGAGQAEDSHSMSADEAHRDSSQNSTLDYASLFSSSSIDAPSSQANISSTGLTIPSLLDTSNQNRKHVHFDPLQEHRGERLYRDNEEYHRPSEHYKPARWAPGEDKAYIDTSFMSDDNYDDRQWEEELEEEMGWLSESDESTENNEINDMEVTAEETGYSHVLVEDSEDEVGAYSDSVEELPKPPSGYEGILRSYVPRKRNCESEEEHVDGTDLEVDETAKKRRSV